ncbi:hypothetical protein AB2B41_10775 [Marimonas sp. MJW-29]|uniref:Sulfotransferase family protein n=1 Tax=Sulfitobacter sediminis TaxID=3234186 RepID=A0ABV3RMA5_9RHOB
MLPDSFAKIGCHGVRTSTGELTRFQVLGERSSGTNFVKNLIARNTQLKHSDELGWKHGFCQMIGAPSDMVVVCMVRNPESWALSMHARPWHTTTDLQRLEFSKFIRAEWQTVIDKRRYFDKGWAYVSQLLQQDRHPLNGQPFSSLFELRNIKLQALISMLARGVNCVFMRLEEVQADPEKTLEAFNYSMDLSFRPDEFRHINNSKGQRFRPAVEKRPATPATMSSADRKFMWAELISEQEESLGYRP